MVHGLPEYGGDYHPLHGRKTNTVSNHQAEMDAPHSILRKIIGDIIYDRAHPQLGQQVLETLHVPTLGDPPITKTPNTKD